MGTLETELNGGSEPQADPKSEAKPSLNRGKVPNVVLIGGTATGKSTAGHRLANLIGFGFIDTDKLIEKQAGKSIAKIFEEDGEAAFRDLEAETINNLAGVLNHVIVVGAGALDHPDNFERLKKLGPLIWISTPVGEVVRRLVTKPDEIRKRPLLAQAVTMEKRAERQEFLEKKLEEMERLRKSFYSRADYILEASYLTSETLAQFIKLTLCPKNDPGSEPPPLS